MLTQSFLTSLSPKAAKLYFQFALLCQPSQSPLKVQISRPHLASLVGLSQRSCTRALAELQRHKLIASHPHSYRQSATYWILPHQISPATSEPPMAHTLNQPIPRTSEPPVAHNSDASAPKPSEPPLAHTSHKPKPLYFQPRGTPNPTECPSCESPVAHNSPEPPSPCCEPSVAPSSHKPIPLYFQPGDASDLPEPPSCEPPLAHSSNPAELRPDAIHVTPGFIRSLAARCAPEKRPRLLAVAAEMDRLLQLQQTAAAPPSPP